MTMEFPPSLDDGEHYYWLPSDIFPDDEYQYEYEVSLPSKKSYFSSSCMPPKLPTSSSASDFTCMAMDQPLICQHFATYPPSSPLLERLIPPSRIGSLAQPGIVAGSGSSTSHAFSYQSGPLHVYSVLQSPYSQAQRVIEIRTRQLQLQQHHHHHFLPIPSTGVGRGHHGGLVRTPLGQGTGVFLPRIAASSTTPLNQTRARVKSMPSKKHAAGGKNMNRQEGVQGQARPISQRKSMSSFGLGQSADFHNQLSPPDMGLPPEWTY